MNFNSVASLSRPVRWGWGPGAHHVSNGACQAQEGAPTEEGERGGGGHLAIGRQDQVVQVTLPKGKRGGRGRDKEERVAGRLLPERFARRLSLRFLDTEALAALVGGRRGRGRRAAH